MLHWQQYARKISAGSRAGLAVPFSSSILRLAFYWPTWFGVPQRAHLAYLETDFLPDNALLAAAAVAAVGYFHGRCAANLALCWAHGAGAASSAHCLSVAAVFIFGDTAVNLGLSAYSKASRPVV